MGFAKYHEDNLEIYDERMYYRNSSSLPSVQTSYTRTTPKIEYKVFCPFCRSGFMTSKNLIDHILASHGGVHEFVYLNNRRVYDNEQTVRQVYSLKLYSFREDAREIRLIDSMGNAYSFWTKKDKYEYDIQSILQARLYSEIQINNIDSPVCIKQQLDISVVSMDKIISGKYLSYLFDEQISEGRLSAEECLIYMKMLIYEGSETESFIECINQLHLDQSRDLEELFYYHFLRTGSKNGIEGRISEEVSNALQHLLNGNCSEADKILNTVKGRSNDKHGCQIILNLLKNDKLGVDYLIKRYEPVGFIGTLEKILFYYSNYEKEAPNLLLREFDEIKLFSQYPLVQALIELNDSINHRGVFSQQSYSLLRELTPLAAIHYCYGIDDDQAKEKILKSMVKMHKDSALIKEYAFKNDYAWMKRRIFVSDGDLYKKAVHRHNEEIGNYFSKRYIDEFPFDNNIQITPLGGEHEIGASCFVISYNGYNIMLDCGINSQKYGDDAYPFLDLWDKEIDSIIISHAHIDHSGGAPKAHAMWPEANIISTAPTKVFLKYLYSDMAKVKNGIVDEFEIENVTIEKDVMLDTLNAMTSVEYEEWIQLSKDIRVRLHPAGHIIGAAMIELVIDGKTILYTGDYCNYNQVLTSNFDLNSLPQNVDYLITEATYFKKSRIDWSHQYESLKNAIVKGVNSNRAILMPAASVGRSQELVCLVGEMKLSGEIPENVPLYIAGMAIPATTQIVPFMNERYEEIIGLFEEFDGISYPDGNAIVIASSGSMSKGSASYKIARYWDNQYVKYNIIANGYLDDDTEADSTYIDRYHQTQRLSLSTHVDLKGMFDLIDYVSPKVVSFVHRGAGSASDVRSLENTCKSRFANDIMCRDLQANRTDRIFDMYEWFMEGVSENV